MKIAFDEHIPKKLAAAFKELQGEEGMLRSEIVSAANYGVPKAISDVPWLEKFAKDGGKVVISGDAKMRGKLHEQKALIDAGFVVIFLARKWSQADYYVKSSLLMRWWPQILKKIHSSEPGQCFEIPFSWKIGEMREVTPPTARRKKPGRKKGIAKESPHEAQEAATTAKP